MFFLSEFSFAKSPDHVGIPALAQSKPCTLFIKAVGIIVKGLVHLKTLFDTKTRGITLYYGDSKVV